MNRTDPVPLDSPPSPPWVRALLDGLPYGLGLFDRDQRLVHGNPRFQELLQLPGELLQRGVDFAALVEFTRRNAGTGSQPSGLMLMDGSPPPQPRRVERLMADGTVLEVHLAALPDGGLAMTLMDISGQRQTAEALRRSRSQTEQVVAEYRKARQEAQRATSGRSQFIANMAHELRTPVNAILGMLQLVEGAGLSGRPREWVTHARDAARSLVGVMDDIMDFASVEAGKVSLAPRPFELEQLMRDLSATFGATLGEGMQEFIFDIDPQLPQHLVGDDRRLRQVLFHLGGNAIKFGNGREVVLRMALASRTESTVTLDVSVTDHGIGIAPEQLKELMQGFGQAESAASRRFGGNGLGLAICRELLRLMGSELHAHSEPGQGSRFGFSLSLPVDRSASVASAPLAAQDLRVLVADSRPVSRQALAGMGRALGWQVTEAATLGQALDALRESRQVSAVLIHWQLEGSEPFSAAHKLLDALPNRPLALVALGNAAGREQLARLPDEQRRKLGAYVCAPVTAAMLADAVGQAHGAALPPSQATLVPGGRPLQGMRLLVAEDNENNQIVTRDLLLSQGAQVEIAVDGLDTLTSIVANGQFDAILMDWQMPNMDGLEATREIRQIVGFKDIPIIALTANASTADRDACMAAGMDAHLGKPVDAGELVATLLRHVRLAAPPARPGRPGVTPAAVVPRPAPVRIDRDGALDRLGGDAGLYARVLERFRLELPRSLSALDQALQRGERKEAHRLVHSLKGSAGTVGAQQLATAAQQLESMLAAPPTGAEQASIAALREMTDATLKALPPA